MTTLDSAKNFPFQNSVVFQGKSWLQTVLWKAAMLLSLGAIFWFGMVLRSKYFTMGNYPDSIMTLFCATYVDGLRGIQNHLTVISQPALPPILRDFFWYPLLGSTTEIVHKIPSFVYGHSSIVIAFLLGSVAFNGRSRAEKLVAASFCGWLAATCPTELFSTGDWRDYALIAFVSLLFFGAVFQDVPKAGYVALTGWLCINSHFFALPLVYGLSGFLIITEYRAGRKLNSVRLLAYMVIGSALFLALSGISLMTLTHGTQYRSKAGSDFAILSGLESVLGFIGYFGAYWSDVGKIFIFLVVFVFMAIRRKWSPRFVRLCVAWALFAFEIILIRSKTNYPFAERYFAPFFGLGILSVVVLMRELAELIDRYSPRRAISVTALTWIVAFQVVPHLFFPGGYLDQYRTIRPGFGLQPVNFTQLYSDFRSLRETGRPILVVLTVQDEHTYPNVYLNLIGGPYTSGYLIARPPFRGDMREFLKIYPDAQIVVGAGVNYDRQVALRKSFGTLEKAKGYSGKIRLMNDFSAVMIDRVANAEEIVQIAQDLGIPLPWESLAESVSEAGTGFYGYQPKRVPEIPAI